ncbi:hypothetical protein COCCU_09535 [Corynebacterium occultum]|uniref:Uncharacterized protein n=1 Tax=Corynebacterium occultum TaxID=2675219 RepID=A0A6B8W5I8_9CORY|nr:hypothetical protein COCCU_09535 [Corynebacterium occultum]
MVDFGPVEQRDMTARCAGGVLGTLKSLRIGDFDPQEGEGEQNHNWHLMKIFHLETFARIIPGAYSSYFQSMQLVTNLLSKAWGLRSGEGKACKF